MESDDALKKTAQGLQEKLATFAETLNPEEQRLLTATFRTAAEARGIDFPTGSEVEGHMLMPRPIVVVVSIIIEV